MHVIRLDSVSMSYWPKRLVLRELSCEFSEFPLVLLGPNGAGKSTLFSLVSGARRPSRGHISLELDNELVSGVRGLRMNVGLVPQASLGVRGLEVRELVAYAGWLKGLSRAQAWERSANALEQLRLTKLATAPSLAISGGESRRMTIAMALVSDPRLLLFDEPTTGLDPVERSNVLELIAEVGANRATIIATHEVDDIEERFAHLAVLDEGEIAFGGTVGAFLALGKEEVGASPRVRAEKSYDSVLTSHRAEGFR